MYVCIAQVCSATEIRRGGCEIPGSGYRWLWVAMCLLLSLWSSLAWRSLNREGVLASEPWVSVFCHIRPHTTMSEFSHRLWGLNSGSHVSVTSTLWMSYLLAGFESVEPCDCDQPNRSGFWRQTLNGLSDSSLISVLLLPDPPLTGGHRFYSHGSRPAAMPSMSQWTDSLSNWGNTSFS